MRQNEDQKNEVTIYYWGEKTGHVALQTHRGGRKDEGIYASFYPGKTPKNEFSSEKGVLIDKEKDFDGGFKNIYFFLYTGADPIDFDKLPELPDDWDACCIRVEGDDEALYYVTRPQKMQNAEIMRLKVSDEDSFLEITDELVGIPADKNGYRKLKDFRLRQINSFLDPDYLILYATPPTPPTAVVRLYTLDVDAINAAFIEFEKTVSSQAGYDWGLLAKLSFINFGQVDERTKNCSVLVNYLLKKGGIYELFTFWDKIKEGVLSGGALGAAAGAVAAVCGVVTTAAPLIPALGYVLIILGTAICTVPAVIITAVGVAGLTIIAGAAAGAVGGAAGAYVYNEVGERLVTPDDVLSLVKLAQITEQNISQKDFIKQCLILINRCEHYFSENPLKMEAISDLKSRLETLLEEKLKGEAASVIVEEKMEEMESFLANRVSNSKDPIFACAFFRAGAVRSIFKDSLTLVSSDDEESEKNSCCI